MDVAVFNSTLSYSAHFSQYPSGIIKRVSDTIKLDLDFFTFFFEKVIAGTYERINVSIPWALAPAGSLWGLSLECRSGIKDKRE